MPSPANEKSLTVFDGATGVEMHYGRPDVETILEEAVRSSAGPVSVDVSGPKLLLQKVRETLTQGFASPISALKGVPSVQLNVETFSM